MIVLEKQNERAVQAAIGSGFASASGGPKSAGDRDLAWLIGFAASLAAVFAVTSMFVLSPQNMQLAALFDSGEYLRSTAAVVGAVRDVLHEGDWQVLIRNLHMLSGPLLLDGPILPSIGAAYYLALGKTPDVLDMTPALLLQAFFHTVSALLVGLIARRLIAARGSAIVAALVWGLYPSAIIASGRFLSETITTVFLCTATLAAISITQRAPKVVHRFSGVWCAVLGLSCAALGLTKPALAPVAIAIVGITLVRSSGLWSITTPKLTADPADPRTNGSGFRRLCQMSVASFCGVAVVLIPWLLFTFFATGQCQITPQRMPARNFVIGANPETDGWGAIPETPFCKLFDEREAVLPIALSRFQSDPPATVNLCVRKIARLWGQPWNDCRNKVIGLAAQHQIWYHYLLLAGCALSFAAGSALAILKGTPGPGTDSEEVLREHQLEREERASALRAFLYITLSALAGHLVYTLFVATSRYGFTVMPLISIWATSALFVVTRISRSKVLLAIFGLLLVLTSCRIDATSFWLSASLSSDTAACLGLLTQLVLLCAGAVALHTSTFSSAGEQEETKAPADKFSGRPPASFARANLPLLVMFGMAISLLAASASCPDQIHAWRTKVTAGEMIARSFTITSEMLERTRAGKYAIVFDGSAEGISLKLNGKTLSARAIPLYEESGSKTLQDDYLVFATVVHKEPEQLNMWRAVEVSPQLLKPGENKIELSTNSEAFILGDYLPAFATLAPRIVAPDFSLFSATYLLNNLDTLEPRLPARLPSRIATGLCWRSDAQGNTTVDLAAEPGIQTGQYRLYFAAMMPEAKLKGSAASAQDNNLATMDKRARGQEQASERTAATIAVF